MRRAIVLASTLGIALIAGPALPTLAAGPEHTKLSDFTLSYAAGQVCDFAVEFDITANPGNNQLVFTLKNGDTLIRQTGPQNTIVKNTDTGDWIHLRGGFKTDLTIHADGSLDLVGNGTILAWYFPTDVYGKGLFFLKGNLHDTLDGSFNTLSHEFVGNATDLCAALGGSVAAAHSIRAGGADSSAVSSKSSGQVRTSRLFKQPQHRWPVAI